MFVRWILIFIIIFSLPSQAQLSSQDILPTPLRQSILYGIGAGALCGLAAITNFKKGFGKNLDTTNVFRGMSYGLYAGIVLGLYLTLSKPENPQDSYPSDQLS